MAAEFATHLRASDNSVPAGERHAALALHSMAAADRDWMLQQLGAERRAVIERLLAELRELGVAAQPQRLADECDVLPAPGAGLPPREALRQLPADVLHQLLRREPDRLIADVLQLGPFVEQAELTRLLRGSGRHVEPPEPSLGDAPRTATRRTELLVDVLLRRAADCAPRKSLAVLAEPAAPVQGWLQRLLRRARPR
jgi:hypothetical protein